MARKRKSIRRTSAAKGPPTKKTQHQRRQSKAVRARRAARTRRAALSKRRSLAFMLVKDSVAELRRRQNEKAVQDYMNQYYQYDPDEKYYSQKWQKQFNL